MWEKSLVQLAPPFENPFLGRFVRVQYCWKIQFRVLTRYFLKKSREEQEQKSVRIIALLWMFLRRNVFQNNIGKKNIGKKKFFLLLPLRCMYQLTHLCILAHCELCSYQTLVQIRYNTSLLLSQKKIIRIEVHPLLQ